jgi:very-short-patch-repair endonuclease
MRVRRRDLPRVDAWVVRGIRVACPPLAALETAVEVDGWAWHVDADRFRNDRRKGNALVRAGWVVLRFTWHDLTTRPAECIAEIRAALTP